MTTQPLPVDKRREWPKLTAENNSITSPATDNYNCIAWAHEVNNKWMWPGNPDAYWPSKFTGTDELEAITRLYLDNGYEKCENSELEEGYIKIAIYVDEKGPTHAARQLESGQWTSKLGSWQDIEHETLESLEGKSYGKATVFLKKHHP